MGLDQVLFEQQRIGFGGGDGDLNVANAHHQGDGFRIQPRVAKITAHALAQIARLAHVEQAAGAVVHLIHTAARGERGDKVLGGKGLAGKRHGGTGLVKDPRRQRP